MGIDLHRDTGDRAGEARALSNPGTIYWRAGRFESAVDHLLQALTGYRDIGDSPGEARALMNLGAACWYSGHSKQSADHFLAALALFRDLNIPDGQILSLCGVGAVDGRFGQYEEAADHILMALAMSEAAGDKPAMPARVSIFRAGMRWSPRDERTAGDPNVDVRTGVGDRDGDGVTIVGSAGTSGSGDAVSPGGPPVTVT